MQSERIGEILIERGVLTEAQVQQVLRRQTVDERPFGQLAEEIFRVPLSEIAAAIAEQILADCPYVNLVRERTDDACLSLISARDAWECLVLPLRLDGGVLVCATTVETLPNAIELIQREVPNPFRFVIADIRLLEQFIAERYDFEGVEIIEAAHTKAGIA